MKPDKLTGDGAGAAEVVSSGSGSGGGNPGGGNNPVVTTGTIAGTITAGTGPLNGAAVEA